MAQFYTLTRCDAIVSLCDGELTLATQWLTLSDMSDLSPSHGWRPSDEPFGARLALVRQRMGWNVAEAAQACVLPVASWRRWERDNDRPRDYMRVCLAISDRTGVDMAWLAGIPQTRQLAS